MTRNEIGVRMGFEDSDDVELLLGGSFEVIVNVTFGVNDSGLAAGADEVRGVSQSFDVKALFKHKRLNLM